MLQTNEDEESAMAAYLAAKNQYDEESKKLEKRMTDLTHGLQLYSLLGLEFEKADGECMKFIFSQIDPVEPSKQFYFLILVDDRNMYRLCGDTNPKLPLHCQSLCQQYLEDLNGGNNIGLFVCQMRQLFCEMFARKLKTVI